MICILVMLSIVHEILANQKTGFIDSLPKSNKIYKAEVQGFSKSSLGYLTRISDTAIQLSANPIFFGSDEGTPVSYKEIDLIAIKRKGAVGRGIGYGILSGIVVGGIIGAVSYKPCTGFCFLDFGMGGSIFAGSLLGLIPGGVIGAISGTKKHRYNIKGNKAKFDEMNKSIMLKIYPTPK